MSAKKILVIDDSTMLIKMLEIVLKNYPNVIISQCTSAEQAIRKIEEVQPDILFLDHELSPGGKSGLDVIKELPEPLKKMHMYSHSGGNRHAEDYKSLGVIVVNKTDLKDTIEALAK